MEGIQKQRTGFGFSKYSLTPGEIIGEVAFNGRKYRIQKVFTQEEREYISIRLYNKRGKFIKQLLMEPEIAGSIGGILFNGGGHEQGRD